MLISKELHAKLDDLAVIYGVDIALVSELYELYKNINVTEERINALQDMSDPRNKVEMHFLDATLPNWRKLYAEADAEAKPQKPSSGFITNYAIIDHAGSVSANKALYKRAFASAKDFDKVYTMKNICQIYSPYAREITSKMKFFHRYNRTPKAVYLVCNSQFDPKAQFIANIWENRNIPVHFVEENPAPAICSEVMTPARRFAIIWSRARGWQFSAPLYREPVTESIDEYTKRPNMQKETGSYSAKRTVDPQKYIERFRAVASEAECQEFKNNLDFFFQTRELPNFLDPDWEICPVCGYPHRTSAQKCDICDHEFEAVEVDTFWEDSYNDDLDMNYDPHTPSLPSYDDVTVDHAELATKAYRNNLVDIRMMESTKFDFR